jgi:hypothetical protein
VPHPLIQRDDGAGAMRFGFAGGAELQLSVQNVDSDWTRGFVLMYRASGAQSHERQSQRTVFHEGPRNSLAAAGQLISHKPDFLYEIERKHIAIQRSLYRGQVLFLTIWVRAVAPERCSALRPIANLRDCSVIASGSCPRDGVEPLERNFRSRRLGNPEGIRRLIDTLERRVDLG